MVTDPAKPCSLRAAVPITGPVALFQRTCTVEVSPVQPFPFTGTVAPALVGPVVGRSCMEGCAEQAQAKLATPSINAIVPTAIPKLLFRFFMVFSSLIGV